MVSVCNLEWSPSIFLAIEDDTHTESFELRCPADSSEIGLKFLMKQNTNDNFVITLQIFSKYACVDRTCLGLSFMTQNRERKTYSLDSPHHVKITELLGDDLSYLSSHLSEMEHAISNFETNAATISVLTYFERFGHSNSLYFGVNLLAEFLPSTVGWYERI